MTNPAEALQKALVRLAAALDERHAYDERFPPPYVLPHSSASLTPTGGPTPDRVEQRRLDDDIAIAMDRYVVAWRAAGRPRPEYIGRLTAHR